jgi:hypothetical protein
MSDIGTIHRKRGGGGAKNPNSLANLRPPWRPGENPNPNGRLTAGAVVKQHWNAMSDWPRDRLERVANDEAQPIARRAAANRWLAALDKAPDLEQIIGHTDGKARQAIDMNVTSPEAAEVQDGMDRLAADPEAFEQMQALANRIYGGNQSAN